MTERSQNTVVTLAPKAPKALKALKCSDFAFERACELAAKIPRSDRIPDMKLWIATVAAGLDRYPHEIVSAAVDEAIYGGGILSPGFHYTPAPAQIMMRCDALVLAENGRIARAREEENERIAAAVNAEERRRESEAKREHEEQLLRTAVEKLGAENAPKLNDEVWADHAARILFNDGRNLSRTLEWSLAEESSLWAARQIRYLGIIGRGLALRSRRLVEVDWLLLLVERASRDDAAARAMVAAVAEQIEPLSNRVFYDNLREDRRDDRWSQIEHLVSEHCDALFREEASRWSWDTPAVVMANDEQLALQWLLRGGDQAALAKLYEDLFGGDPAVAERAAISIAELVELERAAQRASGAKS